MARGGDGEDLKFLGELEERILFIRRDSSVGMMRDRVMISRNRLRREKTKILRINPECIAKRRQSSHRLCDTNNRACFRSRGGSAQHRSEALRWRRQQASEATSDLRSELHSRCKRKKEKR